jgi:hypothetical protein
MAFERVGAYSAVGIPSVSVQPTTTLQKSNASDRMHTFTLQKTDMPVDNGPFIDH